MPTYTTMLADALERAVTRLDAAEQGLEPEDTELDLAQSLASGILARIEFDLARTAAARALLALANAVAGVASPEGWRRLLELYTEAGCRGVRPLHRVVLDEIEDRETVAELIDAVRAADDATAA